MEDIKYIILDFGKVLAGPSTDDWFMTKEFLKHIDVNLIDKDKFYMLLKKYSYLKDKKITTLEEEYDAFYKLYDLILKKLNYPNYDSSIAKAIAYNFTYEDDKYIFYDEIVEELEMLSKKYTLILLSDNWPCVIRIMKNKNIYKYFKKLYISSFYGVQKSDIELFDYPIKEFKIQENEAIFIDDNESLLDIATTKGLQVRLMDRSNKVVESKYQIINNLKLR